VAFRVVCPDEFEWITRPVGGLIHVAPGTPLQAANHGEEDLVLFAYGTPPESEHAQLLDPAA
jgi:hypothetical protein